MKIIIETIPHDQQRIPGQVGDWVIDNDHIIVRVSELGDWRFNAAVGIHEVVEALLCLNDGVSQEAVDKFDANYAKIAQYIGLEAGDSAQAPYARQHCYATSVERMLIAAMGLSWAEYDAAVEAL